MQGTLATEVARLVDWGWHVDSSTETTASLETRGPFNWLIFALLILLLFPFVGGLLYVAFWLVVSRVNVFMRVEDGKVVTSGDTWYVDEQAAGRSFAASGEEIKRQGFWKTMGPSIVAVVIGIVLWILLIWALMAILD